ncbi:MAG: hypothetical protein M2R45_04958 [Verrucomicrobia subdivision 3 bacterium]|nr:hypothetical protein [Limisphaerales bacterium]MCS1415605.1 hypothetical protein [Limisphaerales bacterium]
MILNRNPIVFEFKHICQSQRIHDGVSVSKMIQLAVLTAGGGAHSDLVIPASCSKAGNSGAMSVKGEQWKAVGRVGNNTQ